MYRNKNTTNINEVNNFNFYSLFPKIFIYSLNFMKAIEVHLSQGKDINREFVSYANALCKVKSSMSPEGWYKQNISRMLCALQSSLNQTTTSRLLLQKGKHGSCAIKGLSGGIKVPFLGQHNTMQIY